jgi:hypothetical protein
VWFLRGWYDGYTHPHPNLDSNPHADAKADDYAHSDAVANCGAQANTFAYAHVHCKVHDGSNHSGTNGSARRADQIRCRRDHCCTNSGAGSADPNAYADAHCKP